MAGCRPPRAAGRSPTPRRRPAGRRLPGGAARGDRARRGAVRRQDQPARTGLRDQRDQRLVRHAGQPARPPPGAGRLVQRLGRRGGRRRGGRRLRHRHRRVDPDPRRVLRDRGLKTTWGRISLDGVRPLAPSLDTVGPMAADVAGWPRGWRCLSRGSRSPPRRRERRQARDRRRPGYQRGGRRRAARGGLRGPSDHDPRAAGRHGGVP